MFRTEYYPYLMYKKKKTKNKIHLYKIKKVKKKKNIMLRLTVLESFNHIIWMDI